MAVLTLAEWAAFSIGVGIACEQVLFWGLARERRNRESERRSLRSSLSRLRRSRASPQKRARSQTSVGNVKYFDKTDVLIEF